MLQKWLSRDQGALLRTDPSGQRYHMLDGVRIPQLEWAFYEGNVTDTPGTVDASSFARPLDVTNSTHGGRHASATPMRAFAANSVSTSYRLL